MFIYYLFVWVVDPFNVSLSSHCSTIIHSYIYHPNRLKSKWSTDGLSILWSYSWLTMVSTSYVWCNVGLHFNGFQPYKGWHFKQASENTDFIVDLIWWGLLRLTPIIVYTWMIVRKKINALKWKSNNYVKIIITYIPLQSDP